MEIQKRIKALIIASLLVISLISVTLNMPQAYAAYGTEGSVLGASIIVPSWQVYINGIKIEDPKKLVIITTNNPSFFGYTLSNVTVNLRIESNSIRSATTTDGSGYWIYNLDKPLPNGTHRLYASLTDNTGASSPIKLAATFKIQPTTKVLSAATTTPQPSLKQLNYLTISLLIFLFVFFLIFFYLLAKRRRTEE